MNGLSVEQYNDHWWLGVVEEISSENADVQVKFLQPHGPKSSFYYPTSADQCWIELADILGKLLPNSCPLPQGTRKHAISNTVCYSIDKYHSSYNC